MGKQLELGQTIPEGGDSLGNRWYMDDNAVFLKLSKEPKARFIGYKMDNTLTVFRDREKHLMRVNQSYGFNDEVLENLNIQQIVIFEKEHVYSFSIDILKAQGSYLHFQDQGFERQIFLPLSFIEPHEIDYLADPKFSTRYQRMGEEWFHITKKEFEKPYMIRLGRFLAQRRKAAKIYPEPDKMFRAFQLVPYRNVKVVIIGQDPYFTEGVADGLAFSSGQPTYLPPSLAKVYEALEEELGFGDFLNKEPSLDYWAEQGVLLLNRTLTVEKGNPNSHGDIGWKQFTDFVLNRLREHSESLVFMLWGSSARNVRKIVEDERHLILEAEHPAFAARDVREWDNGHCFTKCNSFLESLNKQTINW